MHGYFPLEINFTKDYSASDFLVAVQLFIYKENPKVFSRTKPLLGT